MFGIHLINFFEFFSFVFIELMINWQSPIQKINFYYEKFFKFFKIFNLKIK